MLGSLLVELVCVGLALGEFWWFFGVKVCIIEENCSSFLRCALVGYLLR